DRPGRVRSFERAPERPAREEPVAECAAERVTRAESVQHRYLHRRHGDFLTRGPGVDALAAAFDDRDLRAEAEERSRAGDRGTRPCRHLHLLDISQDNRRALRGLARPPPGIVAFVPEVVPGSEGMERGVPAVGGVW